MTLALAWLRKVGSTEELLMATDSRLRFGCAWDCCPKVFPLARGDSAISFAGNTMYAYPIVLQIRAAVEHHRVSLSRAQDLTDLKGHILRIANDMCSQIHDLPAGQNTPDTPDVDFLLGGFSWKRNAFVLWRLHFDGHIKRFTVSACRKMARTI